MPVRFEIDVLNRRVWATAEGKVKTDEIQAYLGDVIAAEAMSFCKLFDISDAVLEDPSRLIDVAATVRLYEKMIGRSGPMAIVIREGMEATYARSFVSYAAASHRVKFFTDRAAAVEWLAAQE